MQGNTTLSVHDFGVKADKTANDAPTIQRALDAAGEAGGGVVEVPPGDYHIGQLTMRPRVTLYLHAGETLWASGNHEDFPDGAIIHGQDNADCSNSLSIC